MGIKVLAVNGLVDDVNVLKTIFESMALRAVGESGMRERVTETELSCGDESGVAGLDGTDEGQTECSEPLVDLPNE